MTVAQRQYAWAMSWRPIDDTLFAGHLRYARAAIDAALAELGYDSLVIAAGVERMAFQDDQSYPFRPSPWFKWLVPAAAAPGSFLQLSPGQAPRLLFVAPEDFWHSPPQVPQDPWTGLFTVEVLRSAGESVSQVKQIRGRVAWLAEESAPVESWESNPPALLARLEQTRCIKNSYELACLREANRIGVAGHLAAEQAFRQGAAEYDIHLAFLAAVRQNEQELPYPPIIGLNEHAAVLHYQRRATQAPARPLSLLIDAGAACHGYASDITRTWAMRPGLFASLIDGMHQLQKDLCEAVVPGVDWRQLHLQAHRLIGQLLRGADVITLDPEEALATGVSAAFLPHGLGHLLGMQVHDVGGFRPAADAGEIPRPPGHPALRLTRLLEPGMVVTVEPGLYFIGSLLAQLKAGPHARAINWPLVERLSDYGGIRIEDDVAVTATGHDNLTRTAFADVA
jgi:Xaa-Pro dipeptidase